MRGAWVAVALAGCITGRGLSDDDFNPNAPSDGGPTPTHSPSTDVVFTLAVSESDGPEDLCTASPPSFTAEGRTGRIQVLQRGAEMGDCVGWTPTATQDADVITVAYAPDSGDGICPSTCPHDFDFSIQVQPGDYLVVWHDQEVEVTVD